MKHKLLIYPDERLVAPTVPVVKFDNELHELLDDMQAIMLKESGLGLAAPQIGSNMAVFIAVNLNRFKTEPREVVEFINPVILELSEEKVHLEEGCLSFPGVFGRIPRSKYVHMKAFNRFGEEFQVLSYDLESVLLQHEFNHLEGMLFMDKLPRAQRKFIQKKFK